MLSALLGKLAGPAAADPAAALFPVTDPAVDGDDCTHDCATCSVQYPSGFKMDTDDRLYGNINGWSTHLLVATGKADWVRDIAEERGSVMEAVDGAPPPANGRLMLSACNMPVPGQVNGYGYDTPTRVLLLPAFVEVAPVGPADVPALLAVVERAATTTTPLAPLERSESSAPSPLADAALSASALSASVTASPHRVLVLLCSHRNRDVRCGQSAPLLRRELERHLRPLGLFRNLDDERPGGVGIYYISHVGGHKYAANVLVYRRPDPWGVDAVERARLPPADRAAWPARIRAAALAPYAHDAAGAAQCLWLARVAPEDCENLVQYTILQGKVVKPARQLRGGFDRARGVMSW